MKISEPHGPRASLRTWLGLVILALPCMMYAMDLTVLNLAIPALSAEFKPSSTELLWIVDIYGFMVAGLLLTMGSVGERIGRRKLLLIGAAAFGAISVAAAFSTSTAMLIAMRALLGVAGATLAPSTLSLIRTMFQHPRQRAMAIGVWVSSYSIGAAIGPALGGALLEHFWWGSVFLAGVPVMVLLLLSAPWVLPEFRDPQAPAIDIASVVLSLATILCTVWGIKQGVATGWGGWPVAAILIGLWTGHCFLQRQAQLAVPMIDLGLFHNKTLSAALALYGLGAMAAFGMFIFVGQYLQLVVGMSPWQAGLWTTPIAVAFIVGAMVTPLLVRRLSPLTVITTGLFLAALGFGSLSTATWTTHPGMVTAAFAIYSLGLAPVFTITTTLVMDNAPPHQAGVAAAISETASELGGALGIALLGSLGEAAYRQSMNTSALQGLPQQTMLLAQEAFATTIELGQSLAGIDGASLLDAARIAFMTGLRFGAIAAIVVLFAGTMIALRYLRSRPYGAAT